MKTPRNIVDHPSHYNAHGSGIECADLILATNSLLGLALKHVWRCGEKHDGTCPVYVGELMRKARFEGAASDDAPDIARAFEQNLPCEHCAKIDRRKAAWYLRRLAKWLADEDCHAVPYGLYASQEMAKSIFDVTPEGHPLRVVLQAAWGVGCDDPGDDKIVDGDRAWRVNYMKRCLDAAGALEVWT